MRKVIVTIMIRTYNKINKKNINGNDSIIIITTIIKSNITDVLQFDQKHLLKVKLKNSVTVSKI